MESSVARDLPVLRALDDDTRWRIYRALRRAGRPLTRREVAAAVDVSLRLTTFHLERLLDAGLLTSSYARPPGRSGPGAGRSAKYYVPAAVEVEVSIPARRYALVGGLLVDALTAAQRGEGAYAATQRVAR
ncbi:MAG: helix-turn-helix domain-containing protein, partial [Actinomycetota bacterium]|nr:helix-turn-helix domain-containing protein [Actinomycetota bacterium]